MPRKTASNPLGKRATCGCGTPLRQKRGRGSPTKYCKPCAAERERDANRRQRGITWDQYTQMFHAQNGRCAVCRREQDTRHGPRGRIVVDFAIDHDHATGRVRGLLCNRCNGGIGLLQDSAALLAEAIRYLTRDSPWPWTYREQPVAGARQAEAEPPRACARAVQLTMGI